MPNPPAIDKATFHFAVVFLITESGKIVGQLRDDIPGIDHPGKIGAFGGALDPGESPLQAAVRELGEETNLAIQPKDIIHLTDQVGWRDRTQEWEGRHFFYAKITDNDLANLNVYEGQGWAYLEEPNDPRRIADWEQPLNELFSVISKL